MKLLRMAFAIGLAAIGSTDADAYTTMGFPPAYDVFAPLQADPTDPHFEFSGGAPVSESAIAKVVVGDYLGIYRWAFAGGRNALQLNIAGAIFTRFDATSDHNLQVIDFTGNVPLDLRIGWFSNRLLFYHDSSHLGDDYLRVNSLQSQNNSWEAIKNLMAFRISNRARLYGGGGKMLHSKPSWRGPGIAQGGLELYWKSLKSGLGYYYWSTDVQSWERSGWTPTWTSQLGLKLVSAESHGRGVTYFLQCTTGPRLEGQFFQRKETTWLFGIKFEMNPRLMAPPAFGVQPPEPNNIPPAPPNVDEP